MGSILSRVTLTPGLTESPFWLNCGYGSVKADAAQVRREVGAAAFLPDKMQACWFSCRVPASLIDGNYLLLFLSLFFWKRKEVKIEEQQSWWYYLVAIPGLFSLGGEGIYVRAIPRIFRKWVPFCGMYWLPSRAGSLKPGLQTIPALGKSLTQWANNHTCETDLQSQIDILYPKSLP